MNDKIIGRDIDFAKWYTDVVLAAKLCRYSPVKGFMIIEEDGYALWEEIQKSLDIMFKETGHRNVYLPLLIPESLLNKEAELVEGFAPEVAWVTHGGSKKLEERLCIRPTSETLFCEYFKERVKSHRDLPILINQWCSVVRWEKETRPFLRTREFLWQEGHTLHKTYEEAKEEALQILNIYKTFYEEYLAIPVLVGEKTDKEKFAGAEKTYTVEAQMYNGVTLQAATSHIFGDKFTKTYDVKYLDSNNQLINPCQTSWGITTRTIGAIIMVHSDDRGLVLPPRIAPYKVNLIHIKNDDEVINFSKELQSKLKAQNITFIVDNSDKSPGYKFAESEVKGIPIRVEIGKRDLEKNTITLVRRDTSEKISLNINDDIVSEIQKLLLDIHNNLYNKAKEKRDSLTFEAHNLEQIENIINKQNGFIKIMWCGSSECELKLKEIKGLKSRCIPFIEEHLDNTCAVCGKEAKHMIYIGLQY